MHSAINRNSVNLCYKGDYRIYGLILVATATTDGTRPHLIFSKILLRVPGRQTGQVARRVSQDTNVILPTNA